MSIKVVLMEVLTPLCFGRVLGAKASHLHSVPASLPRKRGVSLFTFPLPFRTLH